MTEKTVSRRQILQGPFAGAALATIAQQSLNEPASAQPVRERSVAPAGAYAHNVEAVGYTDLDHRPAFKMAIREVRGRWYLYTGHFWHAGWSIVDVTDPTRPEVAKFVPYNVPNTWTLQMDLSGDTMITALEKPFANFGGNPNAPFGEGVLIWDIADPVNPRQLGHFKTGGTGTHRNLYPGGRYVHLAAGMPGYRGNIYVILDIADRSNPREAGRWWVPGQHEAGGESFEAIDRAARPSEAADRYRLRVRPQCLCGAFCASAGDDVSLHGPPYVAGNHAYLPYGAAGMIILDISDVSRPEQIGCLRFSPPSTPGSACTAFCQSPSVALPSPTPKTSPTAAARRITRRSSTSPIHASLTSCLYSPNLCRQRTRLMPISRPEAAGGARTT